MNRIIAILLFLNLSCVIYAQEYKGVNFRNNYTQVFELSESEDKLVFLYFHAPNCEACDRLEKFYKNISISKLYNEHYVSFSLDVNGSGKQMAKDYGVFSFPTLLYLTEKGQVKYGARGYRDGKSIFEIGKLARLSNRDIGKAMDRKYKSDPNDTDHLYDYIEYLIVKEKFSKAEKLLKVYFAQKDKIEQITWMNLALDFASDPYSNANKVLLEEKDRFINVYGEKYISRVILNSIINAVSENYTTTPISRFEKNFINEAKKVGYDPNDEELVLFFSEFLYSGKVIREPGMPPVDKAIYTKYAIEAINVEGHLFDQAHLIALGIQLLTFYQKEEALEKLYEVLEANFELEKHYSYLDLQSVALYLLDREDDAIEKIVKARELALSQGDNDFKPSINVFKKLGIVK